MIRLRPTKIELSDSDIESHLQRIMLRHELIADFEHLDIDSYDEDEDDERYMQSPGPFRESGTSSSSLDSSSDIVPGLASTRDKSGLGRRYQVAPYNRTSRPEIVPASVPQVDGASCMGGSVIHIRGIFESSPTAPCDGYSRPFSVNETAFASQSTLFAGYSPSEHVAEWSKYSSHNSKQQDHSSDVLDRLLSTDFGITTWFDSVLRSLRRDQTISPSIGRNPCRLTDVSLDKQHVSQTQTAPQKPSYWHATVRKSSTLRHTQSVSTGDSDITSELPSSSAQSERSSFNIENATASVDKRQQQKLNLAETTDHICACVCRSSSQKQQIFPDNRLPGSSSDTRRLSQSSNTAGSSMLDPMDTPSTPLSPKLQSTPETNHATLGITLPRPSFSASYFPTTYERTKLHGNAKAEHENELSGEPAATTRLGDSFLGASSPEMDSGLTGSIMMSSPRVDMDQSSDSESMTSSHHGSPSLASVVSGNEIGLPPIRRILAAADVVARERPSSTSSAATDLGIEKHNNSSMTRGSGSRHLLFGSSPGHPRDRDVYNQDVTTEAPVQLSRTQIVPEDQVTSNANTDCGQKAYSVARNQQLVSGSRQQHLSPVALPEGAHRRVLSSPCIASPGPSLQATRSRGVEPTNQRTRPGRSGTRTPIRTRPDLDPISFQRALAGSLVFRRKVNDILAELDRENDNLEDFGWGALRTKPMGDWFQG